MQSGEMPQFGSLHHDGPSRRGSHEYTPPPNIGGSHQQPKRTYSTISIDFSPVYQSQRPSVGWAPPEPSGHLPPPSSVCQMPPTVHAEQSQPVFRPTHSSPNGLAPHPTWQKSTDSAIRPGPFGSITQAEQTQADNNVEWDENTIDEYNFPGFVAVFQCSQLLDTIKIFILPSQYFLTQSTDFVPASINAPLC